MIVASAPQVALTSACPSVNGSPPASDTIFSWWFARNPIDAPWRLSGSVNWHENNIVSQRTNDADQSRTSAFIGMHEHKLFVLEGTVPRGYPEPGLFQQSLGWVDEDGNRIRYRTVYSNAYHALGVYPAPPIVGRDAR